MAPTVSKHTAGRGKGRIYLCRACGVRHVPPTGANCPHTRRTRSAIPKAVGRSARKRLSMSHTSPAQSMVSDGLPPPSRRTESPSSQASPNGQSTDDDSRLDDLFAPDQLPDSPPDAQEPTTSSGLRGTDLQPFPPVPTPRISRKRRRSQEPAGPDPTQTLLDQIRLMQEENRREFSRIEQQGLADRRAMEATITELATRVNRPVQPPRVAV